MARLLEEDDALSEEKATDEKLTEIVETAANPEAEEGEEEEEEDRKPVKKRK
jgi:hypothetical protein